jgi:iron uptake system EfeUOB component EfeO/EfeM
MSDFNLQKFLIENKMTRNSRLLKENNLRQDIEDFIDSIESDNYQRSKDNDPDYEEVEPTMEFFLDMYPEYEGREDEIKQFLK